MVKNFLLTLILVGLLASGALAQTSTITVNITNLRNDNGKCYVCIYSKADGFLKMSQGASRQGQTIKGGTAHFQFEQVKDGNYAIAAFHDENDNGKLDQNFLGIPKEGVGVSNNHMSSFGPPKYSDAKFEVAAGKNVELEIRLKY